MIAICGGLMRTGSVAMYQIMGAIVLVKEAGHTPVLPHGIEAEYVDDNVAKWAKGDGVTVIKLHRWRESLEPVKDRIKVVMTIRDMRDVVVSLMRFRRGNFQSSVHSAAFKGNIEGQAEWEEKVPRENLLTVRYEEFVPERRETIYKVANHIGRRVSAVQAADIDRTWDMAANIERAKKGYSSNHPEYMSERHIHNALSGKWATELTPEQVQEIVDTAGPEWFLENDYEL